MIRIRNKVLIGTVKEILERVRAETSMRGDMYLRDIKDTSNALMVTCPFHGNHQEKKPACGVFIKDHSHFKEGDYHCFSCGSVGSFAKLVGACFGYDEAFGEEWLIEHYGAVADTDTLFTLTDIELPPVRKSLEKCLNKPKILDPQILEKFKQYHPYMWQRKLTREVVDLFQVGYHKETDSITFPVWDENNNLVMITEREVGSKRFYIQDDVEKPVYLLNYVKGKDYPFVVVTEAQIDALTCWSYGVPAVALLGVGSEKQFNILNRSGICEFVTMFDNDIAGRNATKRFNKNIRKDAFVTNIKYTNPRKKDVNDLTKEEFDTLLNKENLKFRLNLSDLAVYNNKE